MFTFQVRLFGNFRRGTRDTGPHPAKISRARYHTATPQSHFRLGCDAASNGDSRLLAVLAPLAILATFREPPRVLSDF